jgi:hypothetical protein
MPNWPRPLTKLISRLQLNWRIRREAKRIAREIYPSLWENVRRKVASSNEKELHAYAKLRAAQLSQVRIDSLMLAEPNLSGAFAAQLLVASINRAMRLVLATLASARRSAE